MRLRSLKHGDVIECYRDFDCFTAKDKYESGAFIVISATEDSIYAVKGYYTDEFTQDELAKFKGLIYEKDGINLFKDVRFTFSEDSYVNVPSDFAIAYLGCLDSNQLKEMYKKTIKKRNGELVNTVVSGNTSKINISIGDIVRKDDTSFCVVKLHEDNKIDIAPCVKGSHFDYNGLKTITYDDSYKLMRTQSQEIGKYNGIVRSAQRKRQK